MKPFESHTSSHRLSRFADGELSNRDRAGVAAHLRKCQRCRDRLSLIRDIGRTGGDLWHPEPPPDLFQDILLRRDAGEQVILPSAPPRSPARRPVLAVASVVLLLMLGGLPVLFAPSAEAGRSELLFEMGGGSNTRELTVTYQATSLLAGAERLRVRGRYRTATDRNPKIVLGTEFGTTLQQAGDGVYQGAVRFPESAVYAVFVVERPGGGVVDSNGDLLWEYLAENEDGVPLFEALKQKYRVEENRNFGMAIDAAREMARLYPDRAEAWSTLLYHEKIYAATRVDSVLREYETRFQSLSRRLLSDPATPATELFTLSSLARHLGNEEAREAIEDLLIARYPLHPRSAQIRFIRRYKDEPRPTARLAAAEDEWSRTGPASEFVSLFALQVAQAHGLGDEVRKWGDRVKIAEPYYGFFADTALAGYPEQHLEAIRRVRLRLDALDGGMESERPLVRDSAEQRAVDQARSRALHSVLGRLLIQNGDTVGGLEALEKAAAEGWDPQLFRALADARFAGGDIEGTSRLLALVATDPSTSTAYVDSVRTSYGSAVDPEPWLPWARDELIRRTLSEHARYTQLPTASELVTETGESVELRELASEPTVLAFVYEGNWKWFAQEMEAVAAHDVPIILVREREPSSEDPAISIPAYSDRSSELRRRLRAWGSPYFYTIDGSGMTRFTRGTFADAVRHVLVLREIDSAPELTE